MFKNILHHINFLDKYSVVYVTVPNDEVGRTIGHGLVKNKLAACVNSIPGITSIYEWKNEINEDKEVTYVSPKYQ